jgi:hypothetical protein
MCIWKPLVFFSDLLVYKHPDSNIRNSFTHNQNQSHAHI